MTPEEWKKVWTAFIVANACAIPGALVLMYTESFFVGFGLLVLGCMWAAAIITKKA